MKKDFAEITKIIKNREREVKNILSSKDTDIVTKTVLLRRLAREIAEAFVGRMSYKTLEDFFEAYDKGESPLIQLEGEGIRHDDIIILKDCPMSPLFEDFKEGADFPDYWKTVPEQYMETFKNEALLHPLCIVHQRCRDELAAKVPKGKSFVHSIAIACRSMSSGKIVYSSSGLHLSGRTEDEIQRLIDGMACAFQVR